MNCTGLEKQLRRLFIVGSVVLVGLIIGLIKLVSCLMA